jgi:hypothetical protein
MSEGFIDGLKGAIVGVVVGLAVSGILKVVPSPYWELIEIGNLIQSITVLESLEHWGTGYLSGWLLGSGIMWRIGLLDDLFGVVYTVIGLATLVERITRELR